MRRKPSHPHLQVPLHVCQRRSDRCYATAQPCTRTWRPFYRTGGMGNFGCGVCHPRSGDAPWLTNEHCCGSRACSGRRPQLAGGSDNRSRWGNGYDGIGRDCTNGWNATTGWGHVDNQCTDFQYLRLTKRRTDERLKSCPAQFGRRARVARCSAGDNVYQTLPMLFDRSRNENL